ncbi:hypothetical protein MTO96_046097 [Rhipicephalus appendiculatus]
MSNERTESDHIDNRQGQITMATEDLEEALLGRRASLGLKLVQLLQPVTEDSREKYQAKFPELFAGIGEMQGEYHIKLKPEARPVSVTTSRRVPLPLLGAFRDTLGSYDKLYHVLGALDLLGAVLLFLLVSRDRARRKTWEVNTVTDAKHG